ncbi:Two-component system response regulator [Fulvivirga imtechensis AK7]|uniref:Two-component system response regulator n=1 Tax=Fulvivirga imtechensis AK7 TaxID=1237149 RepID=L8JIB3_9BACT|nr:response regulator transcription factor [Fulvivirga imtechensis]ELR68565.1 Two-component system response regulator [Fulvivirga imtechensis AK7]
MANIKVLYVEDEPALGRIVKESLESRKLEVHMVTDGARVLEAYQALQPDVCVLDIMLPNKDGYAVARDIRKISSVPIIFLTAKTQTEDLLKGFDAGGNDYLRKPFSMEELIVRIHNLLNLSKRSDNEERVVIGSYELWADKYELRKGDQVRKLSYRETCLLRLLTARNEPVLRKDILMELWGDDSFFNSRNLDVYITKLRDYLKEDPNIQIITLRGVGYHLVAGHW